MPLSFAIDLSLTARANTAPAGGGGGGPPDGFAFVSDANGNRVTDKDGNKILAEAP